MANITISGIELSKEQSTQFIEKLIDKSVDMLAEKIYNGLTQKQANAIFNSLVLPKIKFPAIKLDVVKLQKTLSNAVEEIFEDNMDKIVDENKLVKLLKDHIKLDFSK